MNIARILYPVKVLGPGNRIGIWMCGCSRGCKGCSNPELWHPKPEYEVTIDEVMELISRIAQQYPTDGFTISGGEPMDQAQALAQLLPHLKEYSSDILIYSGYRIEELRNRKNAATNDTATNDTATDDTATDDTATDDTATDDTATDEVLSLAAVLIDGEYREEENTDVLLRGSANQRIHILNPDLTEKYREYLSSARNQIQNFTTSNGVVSVGIHKRGFSG